MRVQSIFLHTLQALITSASHFKNFLQYFHSYYELEVRIFQDNFTVL